MFNRTNSSVPKLVMLLGGLFPLVCSAGPEETLRAVRQSVHHRNPQRLIGPNGTISQACREIYAAREQHVSSLRLNACIEQGYVFEGMESLQQGLSQQRRFFARLGAALGPRSAIGNGLMVTGAGLAAVGANQSRARRSDSSVAGGAPVRGVLAAGVGTAAMGLVARLGAGYQYPEVYLRALAEVHACGRHGDQAGAYRGAIEDALAYQCDAGRLRSPGRIVDRAHLVLDLACLVEKMDTLETELLRGVNLDAPTPNRGGRAQWPGCNRLRIAWWRSAIGEAAPAVVGRYATPPPSVPELAVGRDVSVAVSGVPHTAELPTPQSVLLTGAATLILGPIAGGLPSLAPAARVVAP